MSFLHLRFFRISSMAACAAAALLWCAAPARLCAQAAGLDATFNTGTGANGSVYGAAVQTDGKIVIGGDFTTFNGVTCGHVARLNTDGSLDASYNAGTGADGNVFALAMQSDGKVVVVGGFQNFNGVSRRGVARLNADGSLDTTFSTGTGTNKPANAVAVLPSGTVLVGGQFTSFNGTSSTRLVGLNADGSVDTAFNPGTGADDTVFAISMQPDGKIIVGGNFLNFNGVSHTYIARLNANGSLDTAYDPALTTNAQPGFVVVSAVAVQSDYRAVVGGLYTSVNGATRTDIVRLNRDGSVDASFDPNTAANGTVYDLALQPDGKIVMGGFFTRVAGTPRAYVARLDADGSLDATFDPGTGPNGPLLGVALQPDGKVVIGGQFTAVDAATTGYVARLDSFPPVITSATAASGLINQSFTYQITASPTPDSYGASPLPAGLSLDPASGIISGTPTVAGNYNITLSATNSSGTGTAVLALTVAPVLPPPVITSAASASGQVGVLFSFVVTASNTPANFSAVGLPPGLGIDPASGLISGTPTAPGTFTATLSAANASGTGSAVFTVTVTVPPANIQAVNILSPPTNIDIVAGETIDLEVSVEAVNGSLALVEFDVTDTAGNVTFLGNSTAPRDHKTWNPTALGDFTLSATATDTTGATARSEIPIHVAVGSNPPVSELLSGLDGKNFAAGSTLPLVALATDASGNPLSNVQFYLDGVLVPGVAPATSAARPGAHRQDAAASPFSKASAKLGNLIGDLLLTMTGTDSRGVTSVSKAATIHTAAATAAFTCALTSPDGTGTYTPGASVTATASALETGGSVAQVEFFLNDQSVGVATGAPYTASFALPATAGQYAMTAIATDTQGVSAASAPVILSAVEALVPPVVTISGSASVEGGDKAKLVFQRTGDTSTAITVRYKVTGAAKAGTDYKPLPGSVTLPIGAASAKIKLKTIDNMTMDGTRVAKVKLLPATDGSYTLGSPATAKLKITDND